MQAAFVEIGMDKAGFLHASDFSALDDVQLISPSGDDVEFEDTPPPKPNPSRHLPLEKQLSRGEEVLVQVAKDPLGTKGARVTSHISLPGRYMVFMPGNKHIGISRRIESDEERKRLKEIAQSLGTEEGGFILRTACEGLSKREIQRDLGFLQKLWKSIQKKAESAPAPSLIHQDLDSISRAIRDFFTNETEQVVIVSDKDHRRVVEFVRQFMPRLKSKIVLHSDKDPLFDRYGIEEKVQKALERRVWLRSGGYTIIDQTEALTTVDVNTGGFVGARNFDDTIFKTNLEAAQSIARQLRLRNLGGIIIIDFIDMDNAEHQEAVLTELKKALARDPTRTSVSGFSSLGLVEMTRKRTRESLAHVLCEPCPTCAGRGEIKTAQTVCYDVLREILREARQFDAREYRIVAGESVIDLFLDEESGSLAQLIDFIGKPVSLQVETTYPQEQYDIILL